MGNIQKRPNGRWRARYRDEAGIEHSTHHATRAAARRYLDEVTTSILTGRYVDPKAGKLTFAAYFEQWLAIQTYQSGTVKAMRLAVKDAPFTTMPLNRIRRSHVQAWVKQLGGRLQPGTVRTRFHNVRTVLRAAQADRLIPEDPTAGIRLPTQSASSTMRLPTPDEVGAILDAASPQQRVFISLCAFAGLRLGEAAALRGSDFNLPRRRLSVHRQVQRAGGGSVEVRLPKYGSTREVALPEPLVDMVATYLGRNGPPADLDAFMFANGDGDPPHQNTVGHWWRTACRRAGVTGVRLHDLRHFYVSGLIAESCDVITVQRAIGHKSATTTLRTYAHLWPSAEDKTRSAANQLMQQALGNGVRADLG